MIKSVIVIDDSEDTVELFSEFLEQNGINVVGKGFDGVTAVKLYKQLKPDLVLLDLHMHNGSGFYAIEKIREIEPKARIIVVTSDTTAETHSRCKKLDVRILEKPFRIEQILISLQE